MFRDRADAAQQLAIALEKYSNANVIVLGIPRGGVETAYHVARHLHADLSIIIVRKLGYPDNREAAFGAIDEDGAIQISQDAATALTEEEMNDVINAERKEITRRVAILRKGKSLPDLSGKTVIIVDDGIATGATIFSAISLCRKRNPSRIVVAAPIADPAMKHKLQQQADEIVILETPPFFYAVGQAYENFENLTDVEANTFIARWENDRIKNAMCET